MSRAPGSSFGFIGLGAMGAGMAGCLLRRGYPLKVFAREARAVQALVDGATPEKALAACGLGHELVRRVAVLRPLFGLKRRVAARNAASA